MQLFEKFRPRSFDEVVGQDKAVAQLRAIESRGGLMKTCAYLRVSSAIQAASNGTDSQRAAILHWSKGAGIDADSIEWFEDLAVSGKSMDRPEWARMMDRVRSGEFGLVVCYDITRAGRTLRGLSEWMHEMINKGVRVAFVKDGIDITSTTGRLMLHILGAVAEWDREMRAEKIRDGVLARIKAGEAWGGARKPVGSVGGPKLTPEQRRDIHQRRSKGERVKDLASEFGVSLRTIYSVANT